MKNRQLYADITDLCCDIRTANASLHILKEYADHTELNQTGRLDNIIMAIGNMVDIMDKLELAADAVETKAYSNDDDKGVIQ